MKNTSRRSAFQWAASLLLSACMMLGATAAMAQQTIKIGYQKTSTLLILARRNGDLEKDLNKLVFQVSWSELSNGLLSTLNSGSVDIHADIADAFALYAQAADAPLTYYAKENAAPVAQGIVVPESSSIRTIADLKGKVRAIADGSKGLAPYYRSYMAPTRFADQHPEVLKLVSTRCARRASGSRPIPRQPRRS